MFWTDWGENPKIERAEMDGKNRRIIIGKDIHWPNGLTIDYSAKKIYWVDAKLFYIATANYDGSNRERMFKSATQCALAHPFAMTLHDSKIYWTDWTTRGIHSTNKSSSLRCKVLWSTSYSPMDIHTYEPQRQLQKPGNVVLNCHAFFYYFGVVLKGRCKKTAGHNLFLTLAPSTPIHHLCRPLQEPIN